MGRLVTKETVYICYLKAAYRVSNSTLPGISQQFCGVVGDRGGVAMHLWCCKLLLSLGQAVFVSNIIISQINVERPIKTFCFT